MFSCVLFYNNYKKSKRIIDLEKEKKQLEEMLSQKEKLTPEEKEKKEKKEEKDKEEKKTKDFLDYCYNMAKSLEEGNKEQKKECWRILLHVHADCIPDALKKQYNVGNIVIENVGKTV